jgi:hypothetical protein
MASQSSDQQRETTWWYAVCGRCNAKWFAPLKPLRCHRCGQVCEQAVQQSPPWWKETHPDEPQQRKD